MNEDREEQWHCVSNHPNPPYAIPHVSRPFTNLVMLPYHVVTWWLLGYKDPVEDFYYCCCAQCNEFTNQPAQLCLDVALDYWAVRIVCISCYPQLLQKTSLCENILVVKSLLRNTMTHAYQIQDRKCLICSKDDCLDEECVQVREYIQRSDVEDLMELFYRHQIDVVSHLRYKMCHKPGCMGSKNRMIPCETCRRVCYCREKCKRDDRSNHRHACVPFYEVWRITF